MVENVTQMKELLKALNNMEMPQVPQQSPVKISAIDQYDLRFITKLEAKKISFSDLNALVRYGTHYLKEESGKYLIKVKKGRQFADFEEAGANKEIANTLVILNQEIKRRQE